MNLTLKIWRQENANAKGKFETFQVNNISQDASFLEMLDILNETLIDKFEMPISYDHDCREGICGMCSLYINGRPHGPLKGTTVCQVHMRHFKDGQTIVIEPFRAKGFPVIRDLMIDRSAFDQIIQAGGYITVSTGSATDANAILIKKENADKAMDAASCIGCGACVAACKNASAMLFVSAKVSQLALLPQGRIEAADRVKSMIRKMDELGFGNCTNTYACEAVCPKNISVENIARMNREFLCAKISSTKVR
jgi:succinate dehydrogenase / fumarate reductase, iron-sulfur subunit